MALTHPPIPSFAGLPSSGGANNLSGTGSPVGVVTPDDEGQHYTDLTDPENPVLYVSVGLTSADWTVQIGL